LPITAAAGWLLASCVSAHAAPSELDSAALGCSDEADCSGIGSSREPSGECVVRCPSVVVATHADLQAARHCREIDGDLELRASDFAGIGADDLPYLERVSGSILSVGGSPLEGISLPALREVGTPGAQNIIELGFDASTLQRISLPALETVHGDMAITAAGALTELDAARLTTVDGAFGLINLPHLTSVDLNEDLHAGRLIAFEYLCAMPYAALPDTSDLAAEQKSVRDLGCCTESAFDCQSWLCDCGSGAAP
jgi:hypothetical protein